MWVHALFSNLPILGAVITQKFSAIFVRYKEDMRGNRFGLTPTLCLNISFTN